MAVETTQIWKKWKSANAARHFNFEPFQNFSSKKFVKLAMFLWKISDGTAVPKGKLVKTIGKDIRKTD